MMSGLAKTPKPPYYAVVFTSERTDGDNGYADMADEMMRLAALQPGFLGVDSAREDVGITVSYWATLEDISAWKSQERHRLAQDTGRKHWYRAYTTRICRVERDYDFDRDGP